MKDTELVAALRQLKVNTKSIACLGCGYEHGCSIHGCRLIRMAADTIEKYNSALDSVKKLYGASKGNARELLSDVLAFFDRWYGPEPELPRMVYDFEICKTESSVIMCLDYINIKQWQLLSATYGPNGYTLFFRRPAQD